MNMYMTTEEKIRVHFNSLVKALEELRTGSRRNDFKPYDFIDLKTNSEIRAIELKLDEIENMLLDLQF
jgi:hypothetical protein